MQARQRLGYEAVMHTFGLSARQTFATNTLEQWLGLNVLAVDGVVYLADDNDANREAFGCDGGVRTEDGYPHIRMCCLMEVSSHLLTARLTSYQLNGKTYRVLSSLIDTLRYPYDEITELYPQRWEIELDFREMKQGMHRSKYTLRSKKPDVVAFFIFTPIHSASKLTGITPQGRFLSVS